MVNQPGACAWLAWPSTRARTFSPASDEAITSAAAPSEIDEALAAVTVPFSRKAGLRAGIRSARHAAARRRCIKGPFSLIAGARQLKEGLSHARRAHPAGPWYRDRSHARPGICRIAVPVTADTDRLALFLCLTIEQADADEAALVAHLQEAAGGLAGGR